MPGINTTLGDRLTSLSGAGAAPTAAARAIAMLRKIVENCMLMKSQQRGSRLEKTVYLYAHEIPDAPKYITGSDTLRMMPECKLWHQQEH